MRENKRSRAQRERFESEGRARDNNWQSPSDTPEPKRHHPSSFFERLTNFFSSPYVQSSVSADTHARLDSTSYRPFVAAGTTSQFTRAPAALREKQRAGNWTSRRRLSTTETSQRPHTRRQRRNRRSRDLLSSSHALASDSPKFSPRRPITPHSGERINPTRFVVFDTTSISPPEQVTRLRSTGPPTSSSSAFSTHTRTFTALLPSGRQISLPKPSKLTSQPRARTSPTGPSFARTASTVAHTSTSTRVSVKSTPSSRLEDDTTPAQAERVNTKKKRGRQRRKGKKRDLNMSTHSDQHTHGQALSTPKSRPPATPLSSEALSASIDRKRKGMTDYIYEEENQRGLCEGVNRLILSETPVAKQNRKHKHKRRASVVIDLTELSDSDTSTSDGEDLSFYEDVSRSAVRERVHTHARPRSRSRSRGRPSHKATYECEEEEDDEEDESEDIRLLIARKKDQALRIRNLRKYIERTQLLSTTVEGNPREIEEEVELLRRNLRNEDQKKLREMKRMYETDSQRPSRLHCEPQTKLTQHQRRLVKELRSEGRMKDKFGPLGVTRREFHFLRPTSWLNDAIINNYRTLLKDRRSANPTHYPNCYFQSSFFYETLCSKGYNGVRRWTKNVDVFSFDKIIFPVHMGAHWCTACIDFRVKKIFYYDSLLGSNSRLFREARKWLNDECRDKKQHSFDLTGWVDERVVGVPCQENGYDCGVFCIKFMDYVAADWPLTFSQRDMDYLRQRIIVQLALGRYLLPGESDS